MRAFFALAWNEIRVEFSEKGTILFFFILPLLFTAVIGIGLGSLGNDSDPAGDNRIPVAVLDLDNSESSALFVETLAQSGTIRPAAMDAGQAETAQQAGEVYALLTIPAGFAGLVQAGEQVTMQLVMEPGSLAFSLVEEAIRAAAVRTTGMVLAGTHSAARASAIRPFESAGEEQQYMEEFYADFESLADPPPLLVQTETPGAVEQPVIASGFNQSSPGQLVTWTLITFLGTSVVFVNERRMGTLHRLVTMPLSRAVLMGGKIAGRLLLGLIQMAVLILSGVLLFGVSWGGSPAALIVLSLCFGLAATSLGLFLATVVKTARQADSLSVILSMSLAALGGAWWPMEITGKTFQKIVQVLPSTWAMRGFNDIILRGQGVSGIALESLVLLGFAVLFFVLSTLRFRFE